MIDDERILEHLSDEEKARIEKRMVRFRTLGCYPLTGAVESSATTLPEIIRGNAPDAYFRTPGSGHRP